jgi:imidazolonepropionase-like amidohydrolase
MEVAMRQQVLAGVAAVLTMTPPLAGQTMGSLLGEPVPLAAFRDVTVIPIGTPGTLEHQTVIVHGGVIARIGPTATVQMPDGARIIDGQGRFLLPGFADMHAHLWNEATLQLQLANGVTMLRDMNGQARFLWWRGAIRGGVLSGPRMVVTTPIFEGTPPPEQADVIITTGRIVVDDSAAAADSVAATMRLPYDQVKVYNNLSAAAYRGIVTEARRVGRPVVGHVPFDVGLRGVFDAGQATIEHLRGYIVEAIPPGAPDQPGADYRSRLVAWRHADTTRLRALARETARRGIWNVPTLVTQLDLLPVARIHELTERPGWKECMLGRRADPIVSRSNVPFYAVMNDSDFVATQQGVEIQKLLVRMLHEEGAGLLVGTDHRPRGYSFHWEMQELVSSGIPPWEVLRAATLNAAKSLGQDESYGSVAEGTVAELVLLGANPLEDIHNTLAILAVYAAGRLIEAPELAAVRKAACEDLSR